MGGREGFTWIHLDPFGFTWIHLGFIWTYLDTLGLTWKLDSLGLTWTHLDSLGLTSTHQISLELTRSHQDSLEPHKTRTKYHPEPKGKRERQRAALFSPIPTSLPDRAYARTNETKRFPGWDHSPQPPIRLVLNMCCFTYISYGKASCLSVGSLAATRAKRKIKLTYLQNRGQKESPSCAWGKREVDSNISIEQP